jgi:hypothetical protein
MVYTREMRWWTAAQVRYRGVYGVGSAEEESWKVLLCCQKGDAADRGYYLDATKNGGKSSKEAE